MTETKETTKILFSFLLIALLFQNMAEKTSEDVGKLWRDEALSGGLALGQSVVGDIALEKGFKTGSAEKVAMHTLTGTAYSALTDTSPISGAIGGATSEFVAGVMESGKGVNGPPLTQEQQRQLNNRIKATTKLVAATVSLLTGGSAKDITTATNVGESAIKHNQELHDKDREVLTATKKENPLIDPEEYEGAILKLNGAMDTINPDKDNPESVAELQRLIAKSTPEREAEIIDKAGDLGYDELLDRTAWGKTRDYLVKEGPLKRIRGATQIYSSTVDLDGEGFIDGVSKLTNLPIAKVYNALTGDASTSDKMLALSPFGSSHNASGTGEANRILQSLHTPVHSPLLGTLDAAGEDFSVTSSKVILGGALIKYGHMGLNVAAGTKYGQYAIGKTDQALSYAASTKVGQTATKIASTTTNWALELAGKTVKTKNPPVVTGASKTTKVTSSSETRRVKDVLGGNGENISAEEFHLQQEAERLLDAHKAGTVKGSGSGSSGIRKLKAPEFHGGKLSESEFLQSALKYLGKDYRSLPNGRYISKDGLRQVRYGRHEVSSKQHHAHFESYDKPNGRIVENTMVEIVKGK